MNPTLADGQISRSRALPAVEAAASGRSGSSGGSAASGRSQYVDENRVGDHVWLHFRFDEGPFPLSVVEHHPNSTPRLRRNLPSVDRSPRMKHFPKTLLLSRSIPPAPTGSGVIIGNLARQFRADEMVVLGAYYIGRPKIEWRKEWPPLTYATVEAPDGVRGARWLRWAQFPLLLLRAWWTLVSRRCKAILVVFPDDRFLLAAYVLARLTQKPLYPYFHNTYLENQPNSRLARWLQPHVFGLARHVFVMSEAMEHLYSKNYPGLPCSPLLHSFNDPLPQAERVSLPPMHHPTRLVLFGTVSASNAEAISRIAQLVHTMPGVQLTVFSGTSHSYLKRLGFTGDRIRIKTVSHDLLMDGLRDGDIILLPHGFHGDIADEEIATIFPTRTVEALISQRPILAHLPTNCFLAEFLRRHQCALTVDEPDTAALKHAINRLRQDDALRARLVRQALITARQFQPSIVAAHLREIMQHETVLVTKARPTEPVRKEPYLQ